MATVTEKWYQKYAWIFFIIYGLLPVIGAPFSLLRGTPPDPPSPEGMTGLTLAEIGVRVPGILAYISSISVQLGNFLIAMGVLIMGIAAVPYRKGEKWAWFIFWIIPVNLIIQLVNSRGGFGWQLDAAFLFITVATLVISYRKFFPKAQVKS